MNPFRSILYQLYLLQLEEYHLIRFMRTLQKWNGEAPTEWRKSLVWTPKLLSVFILSLALHIVPLVILGIRFHPAFFVIFLFFFLTNYRFYYYYLYTVVVLLQPLDTWLKQVIVRQAKEKLKKYPHLKIIGIAGSFGKTTFKEMLAAILSQKYTVVKTPENINTPLGIARLIQEKVNDTTQILIAEIGEYYPGDIRAICELVPPDIAVITGINEAHLEKMGSMSTTVATIFEIAGYAKENATIIMNADSEHIKDHYKQYVGNRNVIFYTKNMNELSDYSVKNCRVHEDASGTSFTIYHRGRSISEFKTPILGSYIAGDTVGCIQISRMLDVSDDAIRKGVEALKPIPHRLEPILNRNTNILVIDDSYNGNPDGVEEALKTLSAFTSRRKVYVTPGLVEGGKRAEEIHYTIGKRLSDVVDIVVLIKNSVTLYIEKGLRENGFKEENIIWFPSAPEAHRSLINILKSGDVVLFQNDWPDNYV